MADKRMLVEYMLDPKTQEFVRKKVLGDDIVESKTVAKYDAETQTVTFPDKRANREYKTGVITYCAENEIGIRHFQRADLAPDKPLTKAVPPRPKKNKLDGDKTETVVEWYFKHRPNEFAARYGFLGKYTGPVEYMEPQWIPRPIDAILEYRGTSKVTKDVTDVLVTERKTHISYTPDECLNWGDDDSEEGVPAGAGETEDDGR